MKEHIYFPEATTLDREWFDAHPGRNYCLREATNEEKANFGGAPLILVRNLHQGIRLRQGVFATYDIGDPSEVSEPMLESEWARIELMNPELAQLTVRIMTTLATHKSGAQ